MNCSHELGLVDVPLSTSDRVCPKSFPDKHELFRQDLVMRKQSTHVSAKDSVSPEERKDNLWKDAEITEEPRVLGHPSNSVADPGSGAPLSRNSRHIVTVFPLEFRRSCDLLA